MVTIDRESRKTLYEQIYEQFRDQILTGRIPENSLLPSTRNLAKTLEVSRNTVESAYQQLFSEGYISSKACSGYRVEKIETGASVQNPNIEKQQRDSGFREYNEQGQRESGKINFQYGRLRSNEFPHSIFRKLINRIVLSSEVGLLSSYNDKRGELDLRIEIMKYISESRDVKCTPDQIIICAGTLSCISLLSQMLRKFNCSIAMEEPGYDSVRHAFINHGLEVIPVMVNQDGIDIIELEKVSAGAVYVTPSHQFPTGGVLPIKKRFELIDWAERNDAYIIEDDYDSELRYSSRPIPSLQSMDSKGRVIYINTFSKSFAPGMRLSFMVLPERLNINYQEIFRRYHCSAPLLEQKLMCAFMAEGHWNRHLRRICVFNKKRHDALISAITDTFEDQVSIRGKNAGLHIILDVQNGMKEDELIQKADAAGVTVYPVSGYYSDLRNTGLTEVLIGFSSLREDEIVTGVGLLKKAWFQENSEI